MISPGPKTSPYDGLDHVIILPATPLEWVRRKEIESDSKIEVDTKFLVGMAGTRLLRFRNGERRTRLRRNLS